MVKRKKHIHKKFNKIVTKAVNSDDTRKYKVSKLKKDKYAYHDFVIIKVSEDAYNCILKDNIIYKDIANFQLAMSYCYNYLFKKSPRTLVKLNNLNNEANRQQTNLMYYKHYIDNAADGEKEFMYARITESNMLYKRVKADIRSLSTSI